MFVSKIIGVPLFQQEATKIDRVWNVIIISKIILIKFSDCLKLMLDSNSKRR